jgi:hypothetical protein
MRPHSPGASERHTPTRSVSEDAGPVGRPTARAGNGRTSLTLRVGMEDASRFGGASPQSPQITQGDLGLTLSLLIR